MGRCLPPPERRREGRGAGCVEGRVGVAGEGGAEQSGARCQRAYSSGCPCVRKLAWVRLRVCVCLCLACVCAGVRLRVCVRVRVSVSA